MAVIEDERTADTVVPRRIRVAEALAFLGLVAALIAAIGPAERVRATYSWPPQRVSGEAPSSLWYTPLLLSARVPESLTATLPCAPAPALAGAAERHTVLSTALTPRRVGGLAVTREGGGMVVSVGDSVLARIPLAARSAAGDACAYRLSFARGEWLLAGGPADEELAGDLGYMPVVNGLFSQVDVRTGPAPTAVVTTSAHATRTTAWQTIAWITAALCIASALALVGLETGAASASSSVTRGLRAAVSSLRLADGIVLASVLGWWVLAPTQWDDGWVVARQTGFKDTRGFSNYYDSLGTNLPIGYWLEWVQHWLTQSSTALLVHRLPAVLCLLLTWVLCRWTFGRVVASTGGAGRLPLWALTIAFIGGAMAWGMTLRPEPVTGLIVTGVLACVVRFVERESAAPLAIAAVLVPLGVTGHQAGIVSIAPLLAVAPLLLRWIRTNIPAAVAIFTAAFAALLTLAVIGADLAQRSADARAFQDYGIQRAWYNELERYSLLSFAQGGTPLRRGAVALMVLAIVAFLVRLRRERRTLLNLPSTSLAVALLLLLAVPSKWPWHFGALVGIAALAAAAETVRLQEDEVSHRQRRSARPLIAIGAVAIAIAWAWGPREIWGVLDLRALDWRPRFEQTISLSVLAAIAPLAVLGFLTAVRRIRGARQPAGSPWRVIALTVPLLVVPMIAFTVAMFVADAAKADSWSVTRQNIDTLRGSLDCGLADDIVTPALSSMRPLSATVIGSPRTTPAWVPAAPISNLPRFALGPTGGGTAASPWFPVTTSESIGIFVAGTLSANDTLSVESGQLAGENRERLGQHTLAVDSGAGTIGVSPWLFVPVPRAAAGDGDAIRVRLESDIGPGAAVAIAGPAHYATTTLTELLAGTDRRTLVSPGLLPFFPCVRQPSLTDGVAEVPDYVISASSLWQRCPCPVGYTTSPFFGLHDVYRSAKLAWTDPHGSNQDVVIYRVESQIPGGRVLPARREADSQSRE